MLACSRWMRSSGELRGQMRLYPSQSQTFGNRRTRYVENASSANAGGAFQADCWVLYMRNAGQAGHCGCWRLERGGCPLNILPIKRFSRCPGRHFLYGHLLRGLMKNDRDGYRRLLTPTPRCFLEGFESWEEAFGRGLCHWG